MCKKRQITTILLLIFSLTLAGCQTNPNSGLENDLQLAEAQIERLNKDYDEIAEKNKILEDQIENMEQSSAANPNTPINLLDLSLEVMESIQGNDMETLSTYVHPGKGLRFTPYTYIDSQNDQVFTLQELAGLNGDNTVYHWGSYDGSGEPIELNFADYYSQFVYDQDFLEPHMIGNNVAIGTGNMIDNMDTVYPDGRFVEFHFTGIDPQYEGIDWASLKLVFEDDNGEWKLVAIIHDQWTI